MATTINTVLRRVLPLLREMGVSQETLRQITVENPSRFSRRRATLLEGDNCAAHRTGARVARTPSGHISARSPGDITMQYVRPVDFDALSAATERYTQTLVDQQTGPASCAIQCIKTPPGGGSPAGLHTHAVDQAFYILSGKMGVEIEGKEYEAGPGTLVVFPAGVPHRNWNAGQEPTVHLTINTPAPDPTVPFAQSVNAAS
jgi:quercetin dioxygenase-like cupin family protein